MKSLIKRLLGSFSVPSKNNAKSNPKGVSKNKNAKSVSSGSGKVVNGIRPNNSVKSDFAKGKAQLPSKGGISSKVGKNDGSRIPLQKDMKRFSKDENLKKHGQVKHEKNKQKPVLEKNHTVSKNSKIRNEGIVHGKNSSPVKGTLEKNFKHHGKHVVQNVGKKPEQKGSHRSLPHATKGQKHYDKGGNELVKKNQLGKEQSSKNQNKKGQASLLVSGKNKTGKVSEKSFKHNDLNKKLHSKKNSERDDRRDEKKSNSIQKSHHMNSVKNNKPDHKAGIKAGTKFLEGKINSKNKKGVEDKIPTVKEVDVKSKKVKDDTDETTEKNKAEKVAPVRSSKIGHSEKSWLGKSTCSAASLIADPKIKDSLRDMALTDFMNSESDECAEKGCDNPATTHGYCRFHYIMYWFDVKKKMEILRSGRLQEMIFKLADEFSYSVLEDILNDIKDEKSFVNVLKELDIESIDEYDDVAEEVEDDDQDIAFETKGIIAKGFDEEA